MTPSLNMQKNTDKSSKNKTNGIRSIFTRAKQNTGKFIAARPLMFFFGLMALLVLLIVVGDRLRKPQITEETAEEQPKLVEVFNAAQTPKITLSATVEKTGVLNIIAQTPGVVQKVSVHEGDRVVKGGTIVRLSTNYQGANAASLSRQLAQKNYDFAVETFDTQKEVIAKQRDLAEKGNVLANEMRDINRKSIDDTKAAITLSEDIIKSLDAQIAQLESTNVSGSNDAAILGAKQGKAATLSGLNQLRAGLRTTEYQTDSNKAPAQMDGINKDLTLKQLDLQEKSLTLSKDIALLNVKLARVNESMMYPVSPFSGTVERVMVNPGQTVNPGMVLATIRADKGQNKAIITTSANITRSIISTESSTVHIGDKNVELMPEFISSEATQGSLHTIIYIIPTEYDGWLTNGSSISISVPVGPQKIIVNDPLVPLDAVYQTQEKAFVYVATKEDQDYRATVKEVTLGEVSGKYVGVLQGITTDDLIIVSRSVSEGELVRTQ